MSPANTTIGTGGPDTRRGGILARGPERHVSVRRHFDETLPSTIHSPRSCVSTAMSDRVCDDWHFLLDGPSWTIGLVSGGLSPFAIGETPHSRAHDSSPRGRE